MDELNQGLSSLVRFGVSDQLIQDLQAIEESADLNGKALYDQAAIYEMRCALLCRNYAKALWEYSHYIALIEHESASGVIEFFWEQEILSVSKFRHWLADVSNTSDALVEDQGVFRCRMGKREFRFNPKRINLMAAWTAFLVMVEPGVLEKLASFRESISEKAIDEFAKYLKMALDRYLEPHLQAVHQQRQGRVLLSWLQSHATAAQSDVLLSDEQIVDFWQHNAHADDGDFKRFVTVADCAYRLYEAMELSEAQKQIDGARSYHQDQWGDDASWLVDEVSQMSNSENLFESLLGRDVLRSVVSLGDVPLKDIKFLTAKDAAYCEKFELAGSGLSALPLTFLRAQIYGLQQARISEDMRATRGRNLRQLIALEGITGLDAWSDELSAQLGRIRQTRLAVTYILYKYAHPLAMARVLESLNDEQKHVLSSQLEQQSETPLENQVAQHLASLAPEEIKALETAFSKINRAGFKALPEQSQVENYLAGDKHLADLESLLGQYATHLAQSVKRHTDRATLEARDARLFSQTFARLYGEQGDEL